MAAYQAPPSLGFSRQEHWSGLPFPPPMHESEKWKGSRSVVSDSQRPHGLQSTRLLRPWDFPGKSTGVGCHCLLHPGVILLSFLQWDNSHVNDLFICLKPPKQDSDRTKIKVEHSVFCDDSWSYFLALHNGVLNLLFSWSLPLLLFKIIMAVIILFS